MGQEYPDPLALAILAQLRADPTDNVSRCALADRLTELGPPSKVEYRRWGHGIPPWLRLSWLRSVERDNYWCGPRCNFMINSELHSYGLDHTGSTVLLGLECYVSEPYSDCRNGIAAIADIIGSVWVQVAESYYSPRCHRVILFPPLTMKPARPRKKRRDW